MCWSDIFHDIPLLSHVPDHFCFMRYLLRVFRSSCADIPKLTSVQTLSWLWLRFYSDPIPFLLVESYISIRFTKNRYINSQTSTPSTWTSKPLAPIFWHKFRRSNSSPGWGSEADGKAFARPGQGKLVLLVRGVLWKRYKWIIYG